MSGPTGPHERRDRPPAAISARPTGPRGATKTRACAKVRAIRPALSGKRFSDRAPHLKVGNPLTPEIETPCPRFPRSRRQSDIPKAAQHARRLEKTPNRIPAATASPSSFRDGPRAGAGRPIPPRWRTRTGSGVDTAKPATALQGRGSDRPSKASRAATECFSPSLWTSADASRPGERTMPLPQCVKIALLTPSAAHQSS